MQSGSYHLLGVDSSLERLENLDLNLSSELLLLGGSSVGKTLGLSEVGTDSLEYAKTVDGELVNSPFQSHNANYFNSTVKSYLSAELLDGESLDGVDVEGRVGIHGGETSRDYM